MGQISSPIISKLGRSTFWVNMWDDKVQYTKKLKEDIFFDIFFPLVLILPPFRESFFVSKGNLDIINYQLGGTLKFKVFFQNRLSTGFFNLVKAEDPKISYYFGKFWIIRYNKWLFILINIYAPQTFNIKKKNSNFFFFKKTDRLYAQRQNFILWNVLNFRTLRNELEFF